MYTRLIGHAGAGSTGRQVPVNGLIIRIKGKALSMSGFKEPGFADRQKAAQEARNNILNKFRSQPGPDDPAVRRARRSAKRSLLRVPRSVQRARLQRPSGTASRRKPLPLQLPSSCAKRKRSSHGKQRSKPGRKLHATRAMPRVKREKGKRERTQ